ncbi:GntR family transcriptional regulator [Staphylococcus chromogenes]|nr:GntR family transcriptional regulator [Staphylococcus chromogenes]
MYLDPNSPIPLFQQLHDNIVADIAHGRIEKGATLRPVRKAAASFGINPATVKKAYDLLQQEGIVETQGRKGTVVIMDGRDDIRKELARLITKAKAAGLSTADVRTLLEELA